MTLPFPVHPRRPRPGALPFPENLMLLTATHQRTYIYPVGPLADHKRNGRPAALALPRRQRFRSAGPALVREPAMTVFTRAEWDRNPPEGLLQFSRCVQQAVRAAHNLASDNGADQRDRTDLDGSLSLLDAWILQTPVLDFLGRNLVRNVRVGKCDAPNWHGAAAGIVQEFHSLLTGLAPAEAAAKVADRLGLDMTFREALDGLLVKLQQEARDGQQIMYAVRDAAVSQARARAPEDGPVDPDKFRWKGQEYHVGTQGCAILRLFWTHDRIPANEVRAAVCPNSKGRRSIGSVQTAISRLRTTLTGHGIFLPWQLKLSMGDIVKVQADELT